MTVTVDYERKIAEKFARRVVRQSHREWTKRGDVDIGMILHGHGFSLFPTSIYVYKYALWTGSKKFLVTINTFDLVHNWDGQMKWSVKEV
jgi:hypothetical protein